MARGSSGGGISGFLGSSDSASADALSDAGSEQANGEDEFVSWLADDF